MTRYPVMLMLLKMRVDPKVQAGGMEPDPETPKRVWREVALGETETIEPPPDTIATVERVTEVPERTRTVPVDETVWEVTTPRGLKTTLCGMVTIGTVVKTFLLKVMTGKFEPRVTKGVAFPIVTVSEKVREVGPLRVKIPLRVLCPLKLMPTLGPLNWTFGAVNWTFAGTFVAPAKVT
jgi:hypothetical protein